MVFVVVVVVACGCCFLICDVSPIPVACLLWRGCAAIVVVAMAEGMMDLVGILFRLF